MAKNQTMSTDARIVSYHDRACRIDKGHLHDLAVAAQHEAGIRELKPTDEDLFVDLAAFPDLQVRSVQECRGSDLDMGSDADVFAAHNREKSDRRVIAYFNQVPANDGSESYGNLLADPVASSPVDPVLDESWPEPEQQNISNRDAGLFNQHGVLIGI